MSKDPNAVALGRKGGLKGGVVRTLTTSPETRRLISRRAALKRWGKSGVDYEEARAHIDKWYQEQLGNVEHIRREALNSIEYLREHKGNLDELMNNGKAARRETKLEELKMLLSGECKPAASAQEAGRE